MKRVRVIGVGPGDPDQVTLEAVRAMRDSAYFVVSDKSAALTSERGGMPDPLVVARERLLDRHLDAAPVVVRIEDPSRERRPERTGTQEEYDAAVEAWHDARARAYEDALRGHDGDAGFLVWGDPAFYDSTIRVLERVGRRLPLEVSVVPGISSVQLLAARHRLVLHEVGQALHVTTRRRLAEAVLPPPHGQGQDNVVVMLNRVVDLTGPELDLGDWSIWWGGNLGTPSEELVAGRVRDVVAEVEAARARCKEAAGWVMDIYLLRAPEPAA
ncbi:MAG: precorrin-6A synthase (deacetylating) [Nocardioides sp.]|uniref:Precorrin-6A synthase (Deacetylating) n=1 Tax=Nocardioides kribbensis TaxID=305517 RepID=A0ABV1P1D3_9ACTN|nr:precorrin-6A synthase (deacetylating) [Nocardioides kribbensis]MBJ7528126.1 precorrin-6A synthase (deacetylating) [Nocardioides sp.]